MPRRCLACDGSGRKLFAKFSLAPPRLLRFLLECHYLGVDGTVDCLAHSNKLRVVVPYQRIVGRRAGCKVVRASRILLYVVICTSKLVGAHAGVDRYHGVPVGKGSADSRGRRWPSKADCSAQAPLSERSWVLFMLSLAASWMSGNKCAALVFGDIAVPPPRARSGAA